MQRALFLWDALAQGEASVGFLFDGDLKDCSILHGNRQAPAVCPEIQQADLQRVAFIEQVKQSVDEVFFFHSRSLLAKKAHTEVYADTHTTPIAATQSTFKPIKASEAGACVFTKAKTHAIIGFVSI